MRTERWVRQVFRVVRGMVVHFICERVRGFVSGENSGFWGERG